MTTFSRRFDLDRLTLGKILPVAATLGALTVALILTWGLHVRQQGIVNSQMERYGNTLASQIASLAAEPLMSGDHVALNRIVARLTSADEIVTAGVYTLDNRTIASIDADATIDATTYSTVITFDETIAGYVRVGLDRAMFERPHENFLLWAVLLSSFSTLLAMAIAYALKGAILRPLFALHARASVLARQRGRDSMAEDVPTLGGFALLADALAPVDMSHRASNHPLYALVVNIFNQVALPSDERRHVANLCRERAQKVCRLYNGRALTLTGTGILALFDGFTDDDHAFRAICAALLTRDLVSDLNHQRMDQDRPELLFRLALDLLTPCQLAETDADAILEALGDDIQRAVLLSATARNNTVAISQAVYESILDPGRLTLSEQKSPALQSLADGDVLRCYLVDGVAESYGALLGRQAELLLYET